MSNRLFRCGDALSQFFNVLLLNGDPNESISGRSYRQSWTTAAAMIDFLLGEYHCRDSFYNDVKRAKALCDQYYIDVIDSR